MKTERERQTDRQTDMLISLLRGFVTFGYQAVTPFVVLSESESEWQ